MKPEEIIAIAVRLFSIALAIYSLRELSAAAWALDTYYAQGAIVAVYVIGTITLLISVLLWRFPLAVSKYIYTKSDGDSVSPIGASDLYKCGFVILGFFTLLKALADGAYWSLYVFWLSEDVGDLVSMDAEQKAASAATLVEVAFGVVLIIGSNKLTQIMRKTK